MPELLTMQDLANGHLDVKALGEAANGDENTIVTTRTGNTYPSAERAINTMFKNGGLPAEPFETKAQMTSEGASLPDGQLAIVHNDTADNGLYVKTAGAWVKSKYDKANRVSPIFLGKPQAPNPALSSKDESIATTKFTSDIIDYKTSKYANINLTNYEDSEYLIPKDSMERGVLSVYGSPKVPVTLVVPSGIERTIIVFNSIPQYELYIKVDGKEATPKLPGGRFFITLTSAGLSFLYNNKLDDTSPIILGVPTLNTTPPVSSNGPEIANTSYVQSAANGIAVENVDDDTTDLTVVGRGTVLLKGALTKDITVTLPRSEVSCSYINNTTGGYTIFVRGRGQNSIPTYVAIPPNETRRIYEHITVAYSMDVNSGGGGSYNLTPATKNNLGGVKVGTGLSISSDGTLNATAQGSSGLTGNYRKPFKNGSDYYKGDFVEHGSGIYMVNTDVTNASKPQESASFTKVMHNYKAGLDGRIEILSNTYEVVGNVTTTPYKLSKNGMLVFNRHTAPLRVSKDFGRTWPSSDNVFTLEASSWVRWVFETSDGELLVGASQTDAGNLDKFIVYKSSGWNPTNIENQATWSPVFNLQSQGGLVVEWGVSIYNNIIVMGNYGSQKGVYEGGYAQYCYLSKDHGKTWETIFDLDDYTTTNGVHIHGVCYDEYWNRIWISHGDGSGVGTNGLYYSDDLGKSWVSGLETQIAGSNFPQSVGIVALPTCILFSSDSYPNGVQRIDRAQGRVPVKGFYEIESAYYIENQENTLTHILSNGIKADWLPNAPYIWTYKSQAGAGGKTGVVLSWDGWTFHKIWESEVDFSLSTGAAAVVGVTPENTIIVAGVGEGVGGNDSQRWKRTIKVSIEA